MELGDDSFLSITQQMPQSDLNYIFNMLRFVKIGTTTGYGGAKRTRCHSNFAQLFIWLEKYFLLQQVIEGTVKICTGPQ